MKKSKIFIMLFMSISFSLWGCTDEENPPLPPLPEKGGGSSGTVGEMSYIYYDGLCGYECFRIPAIVKSKAGTLLAFAEARKLRSSGDSGDIDLMVRRSEDDGVTWGKGEIIWNDGENTCGNPVPIVDMETGRIHLLMTWNDGRDSWGTLVNGTANNTRRPFYSYSDDDGITWSVPRELTAQIKDASWGWYGTGPCHGIQVQNGPYKGRLVAPNYYTERVGAKTEHRSHVAYSDDNGATWTAGGPSPDGMGECAVTELADGSLLLHMRQTEGNYRYYAVSTDGGQTWGETVLEQGFPDPQCQAGLTSTSGAVFISHASSTERENMTIRMSNDNGRTWSKKYTVYEGLSAYSDIVMVSQDKIAILFEGGVRRYTEGLSFRVIELNEFK